MKVIARPRQGGKTTELIKLAADEFLYVVCSNSERVRQIARMARGMGLNIPEPLTWREFSDGHYYGQGIKGFVIDDLDTCIQEMTHVPVRAVSLTDADAPVAATPGP